MEIVGELGQCNKEDVKINQSINHDDVCIQLVALLANHL